MWIGANINYVSVVTGSLAYAETRNVWQCLVTLVIGNLLGGTVVGLCSIMGPRTGSAGIIASRSSFGQLGAFLPMAISFISALSWFSIQSLLATQSLDTLLRMLGLTSHWVMWLSLIVVLTAEIVVAAFGHATILAAERWIAVVLAALFAAAALFLIPQLPYAAFSTGTAGSATFAHWWVALGVVFALPLGWANFASDYSRYLPEDMSWRRIALLSGGGQFMSLMFCEIIGALFALALHGTLGNDPFSQLHEFLPAWFMGPFLVAIVLGGIAANVPNGYTAALGILAMRVPITRIRSLAIIAVFTLLVRIASVYYSQFYDLYQQFLGYMVFWTAPWAAIVITDFFLRRGRYDINALVAWRSGEYWFASGFGWAGIAAFLAGVAASVAFSYSDTFPSPIARRLFNGADLSSEFGILLPILIYYLIRRRPAGIAVKPPPLFEGS
jgi:nucleobase:cation symporter-1, NCS1 family